MSRFRILTALLLCVCVLSCPLICRSGHGCCGQSATTATSTSTSVEQACCCKMAKLADAKTDDGQRDFGQTPQKPKPSCKQCLCDGAVLADAVVAPSVIDFDLLLPSPPQLIIVSSPAPATLDTGPFATVADTCCLNVRLLI